MAGQCLPRACLVGAEHASAGEDQRCFHLRQWNHSMMFDPKAYGATVAEILELDANGQRLMPLAGGLCSAPQIPFKIETAGIRLLFPNSYAPEAALCGLYLYFSCREQAHEVAQTLETVEGSFWHGIVHRQEPDASNARYWFGRVRSHPVYPELARAAEKYPELSMKGNWDP